jgi:hypothetical protein
LADLEADPVLARMANMNREDREVVAKLIDLIESAQEAPARVKTLRTLIENLHLELLQFQPSPSRKAKP